MWSLYRTIVLNNLLFCKLPSSSFKQFFVFFLFCPVILLLLFYFIETFSLLFPFLSVLNHLPSQDFSVSQLSGLENMEKVFQILLFVSGICWERRCMQWGIKSWLPAFFCSKLRKCITAHWQKCFTIISSTMRVTWCWYTFNTVDTDVTTSDPSTEHLGVQELPKY